MVRGLPATERGQTDRQTDRQTCRSLRPYRLLYPFPGPASSSCPFTLAARPNTIIRDLGRGCSDGCCHIPRFTVGWGQRHGEEAKDVCVCVCACATTATTHTHPASMATLDHPWALCSIGVGWPCLPRAGRQGKRQKMKPVLPSSHRRPFWPSVHQLRMVRLRLV